MRIELGKKHLTRVAGKALPYEIGRTGQSLRAGDGAPSDVVAFIKGLRASPHWRKLQSVRAGPDGVLAERKVDTESGWMWDLWRRLDPDRLPVRLLRPVLGPAAHGHDRPMRSARHHS